MYFLKHLSCVVTSHQVILQKSEVESVVHSPGDHILLSADKYEIKVMLVVFLKNKETRYFQAFIIFVVLLLWFCF